MSESPCINLAARFGRTYRITFEESNDPRHRRREQLDPWCMEIPGRFGTVYPAGGNMLGVMLDNHPVAAKRLAALPCCRIVQDGDREKTFLFDVAHFREVAAIVLPWRRRRASSAQCQHLAGLSQRFGFQMHQSVRFFEAPTHANGKCDQNLVPTSLDAS